jgi:HAE1 family hydrophobic/amphiphilic exporter-1
MKITELSIKRSTIPVVLFVLLGLGGLFCYTLLNKELTPSIEMPVNAIMTTYPGAAPAEVENSVTKNIEDAASSLEGVDKIMSYSFESMSLVVVQYKFDINGDVALRECERKVNAIKNKLPETCKDPQYFKFDVNQFPIMSIAATSKIPDREFYDLIDQKIKTELSQVKGVAGVNIIGGNQRQISIKVNEQKLEQYGIALAQIKQLIQAGNVDFPIGKIKDEQSSYIIRVAGKITSLDQLSELIIGASKDGSPIKLNDVAAIVDDTKKASKLARINGQPAIGIDIQKQKDGNAVNISKEIRSRLKNYETQYSTNNLKFTIASDNSEFTNSAVNSVMEDLLLAIIFVSIAMLLFLHTFRNLIFVFISIPTSLVSTFTIFYYFGFSLNLLTLLALSIVVGAIVDDAIVVLENIYRHLEMGKNRVQASYDAIKELGLTVVSITLVLVAVFLPIGLVPGVTGMMLRAFSLVIVASILLSLLVSFTLVPLLTSRFGKVKHYNPKNPFDQVLLGFEFIVTKFKNLVLSLLRFTLRHKILTVSVCATLFAGAIYLVAGGYIQSEFMDAGDRGEFVVSMELDKTATLEQTGALCLDVEKTMLKHPEITNVYTKVGAKGGVVSISETPYGASFVVKLVPKEKRTLNSMLFSKALQNELMSKFAGPIFKIEEISMMGMTRTPIELYVRGSDFTKASEFSSVIADELRAMKGTRDVSTSVERGNREMIVTFDREKLSKLGLTIGEAGNQMYLSFEGNRDLKYRSGNNEYDIFIALDEFNRKSKTDIENIAFLNRSGQVIKLSQVASITEGESPSVLNRYNKLPAINVKCNLTGVAVGTIGKNLKDRLAKIGIPDGVEVIYAGDLQNQKESFSGMMVALLASLIFMYFTMVVLYNSYVYPFVVMLSLPLSIIGALLALALAGKSLSLFAIMGIIMLMGLVAKNAILVVDFANKKQENGLNPIDAVIEATSVRFRPILMTNIALIAGLLPIALSSGAGAEWKSGLGWTLVGGLSSSMILSMIVVPVLYVILNRFARGAKREKNLIDNDLTV